ncbi:MAG: 3-phosphoserine/phosphohydroxythreonine transaminase [Betaproteobacteria bacterium]|nr:3-phosphoserine/phosphohydroxythreonine transaminase [Betaproteobacteria bacterium]
MPHEVLRQAKQEFLDWDGSGFSMLETPFTGDAFKKVLHQARDDLRELLNIPDNYRILFMHGGASAQFSLVPLNLLGSARSVDHIDTGYWSSKSLREARRYCKVHVAASSADSQYDHMPENWKLSPESAYCHFTSNETANGVQFHQIPETGGVPLVVDMTSDFLSRPLDVSRYGLIYASAQKNVGPAGVTVVIVRDDLLGKAHPATPTVFNYAAQAEADSMLQTPVTFSVYLAGLVFRWLRQQGGIATMEQNSLRRSSSLYQVIDDSNGFYCCPIQHGHRSHMNICFSTTNDTLAPVFLSEATSEGLMYLKGHPVMGGMRASLYNAMPDTGVMALIEFMRSFAEAHRYDI